MRESGQIIEIREGFALVCLNTTASCASCAASGMCHISGTAKRQIRLPLNGLSVEVGDFVDIETPARSLLSAAFLIFIFPLLLSGTAYFVVFHHMQSQGWALVAFFVCFIIAELCIMVFDRLFGRSTFFEPKIIGKKTEY
ncbi:SoxR reducing system RseC family protein [bacterium]|nr:SoxR reducing system RseC family protein [bacterium]